MTFYACSSCSSYVKERDAACPFCGTARAPQSRITPRRAHPPGMSRGQWLVLGSVLAIAGCESHDPGFECGPGTGLYCDRLTQYCREYCSGLDCSPSGLGRFECVSGTCSTGSLLENGWASNYCTCSAVADSGAVTQVCASGCYGAPPARLERLAGS